MQQSDASVPADLFAAMSIKTLTAEQLYDCINQTLMRKPNDGPAFLPAAIWYPQMSAAGFVSDTQWGLWPWLRPPGGAGSSG